MHIPADVIRRIASELASTRHRQTLSHLSLANWEAYSVCTPLLYAELEVSARRCSGLLNLSPRDVDGFQGFDSDGECLWDETCGGTEQRKRVVRRLDALSHVRRVVIRSLPPDHVSARFGEAAITFASLKTPVLLFPQLHAVSILPDAVDALRTWTPDNYDQPHNPPFLEALSAGSRPTHFCLAFRLVPSVDWELHRELTTAGQYALIRKIALLAETWDLQSATFHDIVYQVPPSVPAATNIYDFAPHAIPHPLFASRYKFPLGRDAIGLPGPEWNIRPWQMGLAVKNLFPSGGNHDAVLRQDTRWMFCGLSNHVLTKAERDDDDSTGVWYGEVEDMVKDSVRVGLDRDLPARDVSETMLQEMWNRIGYEKQPGECPACYREWRV